MRHIRRLLENAKGATAVEYSLILALIFLAMLTAVQSYGVALGNMWNHVATEVLAT